MSTYVLMKILESTPGRYDRGIRMLTLGMVDRAYDRLAVHIHEGQRVLDIGCGTGALTLRAAKKGAAVKGIDVNAGMLEIARKRILDAGLSRNAVFSETGVAELGNETTGSYDAVMSGLCFSELSEDELTYTLNEIKRLLKPGGMILVADEVVPAGIFKKLLHWLIKFPLAIITYIVTQTGTRAIKHLPEKVRENGFLIESLWLNKIGDFVALSGRKPQ
jgi:ubiquinone/menaquinone biosynthesis C-methylase UbiE